YAAQFIGGNVGIGTASPSKTLTVSKGILLTTSGGTPSVLSGVELGAAVGQVGAQGKYVFAIQANNAGTCSGATVTGCELQIYDATNPSSLTAISGYNAGLAANGLFVSGKYVYLGVANNAGTCNSSTDTGCEIRIIDISNISAPTFVGGVD